MTGSRFDHDPRMKIAQMYVEADTKIMNELSCDVMMAAMRNVNRIRMAVLEKVIDEARAESPSSSEALNKE